MVVKSDAMLQHEKVIAEVVAHNPKHPKPGIKYDIAPYMLVVSGVLVIAVAAISIMGR